MESIIEKYDELYDRLGTKQGGSKIRDEKNNSRILKYINII